MLIIMKEGRADVEIFNLTNLVRKKLQKGKSLSVIAEECEEEESVIQEIIESINAERWKKDREKIT